MHLHPQVIFLVDHQADLLALVDGHAAGAFGLGMLAADELPLDQELPIDAVQRADVDVAQFAREPASFVQLLDRRSDLARSRRGRCRVARLMKGKSARLRARRMRLLMTMSDSGPEPRSHSPLVFASSCRLRLLSSTVTLTVA